MDEQKVRELIAKWRQTAANYNFSMGREVWGFAADELEAALAKAGETSAEQPKQYKHFLVCNGDRRFPAGEPGHCCSCFNDYHTRQAMAPPYAAPELSEELLEAVADDINAIMDGEGRYDGPTFPWVIVVLRSALRSKADQ